MSSCQLRKNLLLPEYDLFQIIAFILIGLISGVIATLIGGASLIAFPALIALGLSPIEAAIAQIIALSPSGFAAAYFDRAVLPPMERPVLILLLVAVICAPVGAILLVITPPDSFKLLVPLLLALATLLFACAKPISQFISKKFNSGASSSNDWTTATFGIAPVSLYSGYFGAGASAIFLAVLMIASGGNYRTANAVKNLVVGLTIGVSTIIYAISDKVNWPVAGLMICGTISGAWLGSKLVKYAPRNAMRTIITIVSVLLTAVYTYRFWIKPLL